MYDTSHLFWSRRGHSATIVQSAGKTSPHIWQHYLASPLSSRQTWGREGSETRDAKLIAHFKDDPYESRLKVLKLPSLELRCKCGNVIQVFNIFHGIDRNRLFRMAEEHGKRGHKYKMFMIQNRLELRRTTFNQRIVQDWNKLTDATVSTTTLNIFKTRLDNACQAMKYIEIGILGRYRLLFRKLVSM